MTPTDALQYIQLSDELRGVALVVVAFTVLAGMARRFLSV